MRISDVARWPVWFFELFTTAKSFTANPIIGNRTLNGMGLHVARVMIAHAMTRWRWLFMGWMVPGPLRRQYRQQGYIAIENFLPADDFAKLREEIVNFEGDLRRMVQGDTLTYQGLLDEQALDNMPVCRRLLNDMRFRKLMMYGGGAFKLPMFFAHCVLNGVETGAADPQKDFHADTFHPTMKAWLFLDDVDDANGPFNYVPGSHRPTMNRLKWEHKNAVAGRDLGNTYARRGSLRVSPAELEANGFAEPLALKVSANTLVMADTHGFHRRGNAAAGSSRLAVYAYSRSNPFNPLPGCAPVNWRNRIEQYFTRQGLRRADKEAASRGERASWHSVPSSELGETAGPAPAAAGIPQSAA
ncbi:MAG: phytanoyl-CoA dioxygenase family protein [Alphaproteobacteria bacterium]|nr:phytanoyl-CoA dioxygenase family protein [Alphaproteobacteria bacterium]